MSLLMTSDRELREHAEEYASRRKSPSETVEQWMARTGKRPELLPFGAASGPTSSSGHRQLNEVSWNNRPVKAKAASIKASSST